LNLCVYDSFGKPVGVMTGDVAAVEIYSSV
jgi:hypothetical protein